MCNLVAARYPFQSPQFLNKFLSFSSQPATRNPQQVFNSFLLTYTQVLFIIRGLHRKKMMNINLLDAPSNTELEVLEINAGHKAKARLISMGLHMGDKVMKYNENSWCPVLIKNVTLNSTKIAIGKRLAEKVMVRYEKT